MKFELIKISIIMFYKYCLFIFTNFFRKYLLMQIPSERIYLLKDISNLLLNYNVVYIKFFQQLCLEEELLYQNEKNYLLNFTDNVPFTEAEIDNKYLNSMCQKYNIKLKNNNPISSGIIAVVYKGTINNNDENKDVIIKLKKIGIEERYNNAYENLLFISKYLNYMPIIHNFNIEKILKDTQDNILIQTDFDNEVKNLIEYNKILEDYPEFISPLPIKEITDNYKNCIVMSDITGMTIRDVLNLDKIDKDNFGRLLVKHGLLCVLYFGLANLDFHAGNAFFYKNVDNDLPYQVGIIDFGICTRCSPENMRAHYTFFVDILSKREYSKLKNIAHIFMHEKDIFFNLSQDDKSNLFKELIGHIKYMHEHDEQLDPIFFFKLLKTLKNFKLSFSKEFNQVITCMNACSSLGKSLTNNVNQQIADICKELNQLENALKID